MTQDHHTPDNDDADSAQKSPKKEKKPSSISFWMLLFGGILLAAVFTYFGNDRNQKKLKLSDFERGLMSEKFNQENVHELTFGITAITFQNMSKEDATALSKSGGQKAESGSTTGETTLLDEEDDEEAQASDPVPTDKLVRYRINIVGIPSQAIADLKETLLLNEIEYDGSSPPAQIESLLYLLFLILFVLFFFMMFRRMGGAGGAMSFGRSRGKLIAQEDMTTTFRDIAGIDEAVNELREVVEFLRTPAKYQALGGRIPRGVLLVGPPGTGKTLLAKAVAGEAGVPFFGLSGSDFVEMFVGVGAARVRDTFQQAVQKSPSIIFIDELDALGKTRGSGMPGGHDEREQTLNALLVEMDGFSSDQSVIVMGATNRPETLDPALMRPGRFDRHVLVDKPDYKGREAILKVHAARIKMSKDVDLGRLAKLTPGFSGADLANLANEAALLAARNDRKAVAMQDFEEAIERVIAGLEKSTRIIGDEEKLRVAHHECGHALVATTLPKTDPVHKISIIPRGFGALGYILQRPTDDRFLVTQTELESRICVMLGGLAAERIIYQEQSTGASNDLERASDLSRRMVTEFGMSPTLGTVNYSTTRRSPFLDGSSGSADNEHSQETLRQVDMEVKRIIDECLDKVTDLLTRHRDILEHMTRDLMEMEVMDSNHLSKILDQYEDGPKIDSVEHLDPKVNHGQEMAVSDHHTEESDSSASQSEADDEPEKGSAGEN